jgi:hypothetical protein
MSPELKKLGRYTLLDRIAEGGAAEVYRGLVDRGEGVQRLVAVKCIHPEHLEDVSFLQFFHDETKLSLRLCHANIVQMLDRGEDDSNPYIVLEYVHGRSIKQINDRLSQLQKPFPVELAAYVAERSAAALHYAHEFRDPHTDIVLNIIHRDVSPQNVMVSYDGVPKLIDFGIAKVLQRGDLTKAGVIKGKPAYLSPEQAMGRPIDARSDLFSLGIVLWEMLTGGRLFGGLDRAATLRAISDERVHIAAPSMVNPSVPPALDIIVLKALERDPNRRFRSAHELRVHLHQLLGKSHEQLARDLTALLSKIFSEEIEKDREELERLGAVAEEITHSTIRDPSWMIPAVLPAVSRGGVATPQTPETGPMITDDLPELQTLTKVAPRRLPPGPPPKSAPSLASIQNAIRRITTPAPVEPPTPTAPTIEAPSVEMQTLPPPPPAPRALPPKPKAAPNLVTSWPLAAPQKKKLAYATIVATMAWAVAFGSLLFSRPANAPAPTNHAPVATAPQVPAAAQTRKPASISKKHTAKAAKARSKPAPSTARRTPASKTGKHTPR